jgi:hypothetical protein
MSYHGSKPGERGRGTEQFRGEPTGYSGLGLALTPDGIPVPRRRPGGLRKPVVQVGGRPVLSRTRRRTTDKLSRFPQPKRREPRVSLPLPPTVLEPRLPGLPKPPPDETTTEEEEWEAEEEHQQQQDEARDNVPSDEEIDAGTEEPSSPSAPQAPGAKTQIVGGRGGGYPLPEILDKYRTPDIFPSTTEPMTAAPKGGISTQTLLLLGAGGVAAWYFLLRKK